MSKKILSGYFSSSTANKIIGMLLMAKTSQQLLSMVVGKCEVSLRKVAFSRVTNFTLGKLTMVNFQGEVT